MNPQETKQFLEGTYGDEVAKELLAIRKEEQRLEQELWDALGLLAIVIACICLALALWFAYQIA